MQQIRRLVVAKLKADTPTLYPGLLEGGIYPRKLKVTGKGATDEAFVIMPGPAKQIVLRPSMVIFGPNDVEAIDGPVATEDVVLRQGYLRMFTYVDASDDGRDLFDAIAERVRFNLHGWQAQLSTNYPFTLEEVDITEPTDSDEFDGSLVGLIRYRAEWTRSVPQ